MALVMWQGVEERSNAERDRALIQAVERALLAYKADTGDYPEDAGHFPWNTREMVLRLVNLPEEPGTNAPYLKLGRDDLDGQGNLLDTSGGCLRYLNKVNCWWFRPSSGNTPSPEDFALWTSEEPAQRETWYPSYFDIWGGLPCDLADDDPAPEIGVDDI